MNHNLEIATIGGGCFWCVESVFLRIKGVEKVVSGYAGGHVVNPTYEQVCGKMTGHAEVIQITFDSSQITFEEILEIFWTTHDPTTPNQQGNDKGPQYRSVIYYHNDEQKHIAQKSLKEVATPIYSNPVVTEIEAIDIFYPAEAYHQNYYNNNPSNGYCRFAIEPKVAKLRAKFAHKIKQEA